MGWQSDAQALANTVGASVLFGVRPFDKGWFVHCDGEEWDVPTPAAGLKVVREQLRRRAEADAARLEREAASARARLHALDA